MSHKILYMEDDANNMQLVRKMLKLTDYQLLEAIDGERGFEMALQEMPDMILMDVNLPGVNGIDLVRDLKKSPSMREIPIVALTADTSEQTMLECMEAGCVSVVHKPVGRFHLLDTIRRYISPSISKVSEKQMEQDDHSRPMLKVLIAEDNMDLRIIFARAFDRRYFSVRVAADGAEAIASLKGALPDVLILDINMPKVSGVDVLRYLHQQPGAKDVKVVVVTGNTMAMQMPEAEYADLFLIKPVRLADLITLAQRLVTTATTTVTTATTPKEALFA